MVRVILANYNLCDVFKIPKNIPLLSVEENNKVLDNNLFNVPYSWYVRWGTLYYFDDKKNECKIKCYLNSSDTSKKHPDSYESDEDDDSEEEESEDSDPE